MKNKIFWLAGIIVVIIIIAVSINTKHGSQTIKIGAALPLTGPSSATGELLRQGLNFKVAELKEQGLPVELYVEDTATDPKQAISAYNDLTEIKGTKVVFTVITSDSMAIKPISESRGNAILWADATHPALTDNTKFILRHSSTATDGAKLISESVLKTNPKKIGIVFQQDEWGVVFHQLLSDILKQKGIEVVSEQVDNKSADFRAQISKIKAENPDGIVYGVLGPAVGIAIKQTRELGYTKQLYTGVGFGLTPDARKIAGDYAKGLLYQEYPTSAEFKADFKARFGSEANGLGYVSYTDIEILMSAIKETKSTDPKVLIEYIKNLGSFAGTYETVKIEKNGDIVIPTTMKVWQ